MKFKQAKTLKQVADFLGCTFVGDANQEVLGVNEIHRVQPGDIVFVDHPKYYDKALNSKATIILIDKEVECPKGKGLLISSSPFDDFNKLTQAEKPFTPIAKSGAVNTQITNSAIIYPNVSIGNNVTIGENTIVYSGAVILDNSIIGNNVIVGPNSVIGFNAFYYKKKADGYDRMHTCGRTIIEDNVEIGACTTIDCGVTADTIIGEGTKLDNHIQIGHDTIVGKYCLFAAHVAVAGCVTIEDNVTLWGQVGVKSDVVIGKGVVVLAQSGVGENLQAGKTYFGSPAEEARSKMKELAYMKRIEELFKPNTKH
jgi:UDP-3-O-[3-hydroxymyristoyl] glucosamine N-acyltransferase